MPSRKLNAKDGKRDFVKLLNICAIKVRKNRRSHTRQIGQCFNSTDQVESCEHSRTQTNRLLMTYQVDDDTRAVASRGIRAGGWSVRRSFARPAGRRTAQGRRWEGRKEIPLTQKTRHPNQPLSSVVVESNEQRASGSGRGSRPSWLSSTLWLVEKSSWPFRQVGLTRWSLEIVFERKISGRSTSSESISSSIRSESSSSSNSSSTSNRSSTSSMSGKNGRYELSALLLL